MDRTVQIALPQNVADAESGTWGCIDEKVRNNLQVREKIPLRRKKSGKSPLGRSSFAYKSLGGARFEKSELGARKGEGGGWEWVRKGEESPEAVHTCAPDTGLIGWWTLTHLRIVSLPGQLYQTQPHVGETAPGQLFCGRGGGGVWGRSLSPSVILCAFAYFFFCLFIFLLF